MQRAQDENSKDGCSLRLGAFQCHLLIEKHLREYSLLPELWTSVGKQGLPLEPGRSRSKLCLLHAWEGFLGEMASKMSDESQWETDK